MKTEIVIEKNVPIKKKHKPDGTSYPFEKMEVGDSFFVKLNEGTKITSLQCMLLSCARSYALHHNPDARFTSAKVDGGIRIWRKD